ncbi:MAG: radical SAM protein [Candidatus Aegiribacteria sp.]|nr:radical SAM protein [Candidatus Aegiribacteria sp.]
MKLIGILSSLLSVRQPSFVILFVTARCNAKCSFCFYGDNIARSQHDKELTINEFRAISKTAGSVPYLLISGGEPVLRDDLTEIIECFVENAGSRFVTVPSNGLSPDRTADLFHYLTDHYPETHFRASLSLDYMDERHDVLRGVKGCVDSVVETANRIAQLRESRTNLSMDLVTVFINQTAGDLALLREFAQTEIRPNNHELHLLRPDVPGEVPDQVDIDLFLRELEIFGKNARTSETRTLSPVFRGINNTFLHSMSRLCRGKWIGPCMAGRKFTVINEFGKVRLCELRNELLGDLRENGYDLLEILHSKKSVETVRKMNKGRCTCTWECAMSANIIYNAMFYPEILFRSVREVFTRRISQ